MTCVYSHLLTIDSSLLTVPEDLEAKENNLKKSFSLKRFTLKRRPSMDVNGVFGESGSEDEAVSEPEMVCLITTLTIV